MRIKCSDLFALSASLRPASAQKHHVRREENDKEPG
jgi:hypothetical protein